LRIFHQIHFLDRVAMAAMRLGNVTRPSAREPFDELMEKTPAADGVTYEEARVGGASLDGGASRTTRLPAPPFSASMVGHTSSDRREPIDISAGDGFALVLLPLLSGKARASSALRPVGAVVMPPWTDLALSGASMQTRGAADPLLTRESLASTARLYVGGRDPRTATWLGCRRSEITWAKTKFSLTTRFVTASVSKA